MSLIESKPSIGIYVGSFDPFHIGHFEVVQVALQYVDEVIIIPNNPNKNKPFRTNLKHRLRIIQLSLNNNNSKIRVTNEDITTLNSKLYTNQHLVGLIGNDQCHKEPKTKVHQWLIIPRDIVNSSTINWPTPVTYIPAVKFNNQQWSSTYIRRQILTGNFNDLPLCNQQVSDYIISNKLYTLETQV
jgi:cytidyltransferase-like protein